MIFYPHWNKLNGFAIKLVLKVRFLEVLTCSCWRPRLWRKGVKRKAKLRTCAVELHLAFQLKFTSAPLRPYSRYPPSLHLLKARWDRSDVTWFLRGQTSDKSANTRNRSHVYFILDNRTFYLKVSSRVKNHQFSKFAFLEDWIELMKRFLLKKIPGENVFSVQTYGVQKFFLC